MNPDFIPDHVLQVLRGIVGTGSRAWIVGGALRDSLLGVPPKDWDVASDASISSIMELFPRVVPVGLKHGTVIVVGEAGKIEVTSLLGFGVSGIQEDLKRRDFTFNALAMSYPDGALLDPHGGLSDLRMGIVRAVDNPRARFQEDPLRILRAARFMSSLGFRIDPPTRQAVPSALSGLHGVAVERVRDEMLKILMGRDPARALDWLRRVKVLEMVLPELAGRFAGGRADPARRTIYGQTLTTLGRCPRRIEVRLAALLGQLGKSETRRASTRGRHEKDWRKEGAQRAMAIMDRWKMAGRAKARVESIIENQLSPEAVSWGGARIRQFLAGVSPGAVEDILALARARYAVLKTSARRREVMNVLCERIANELEQHPPLTVQDLAMSGEDVMRLLRLAPGPRVGFILRWLHQRVLKEPAQNSPERLETLVMSREWERKGSLTGV